MKKGGESVPVALDPAPLCLRHGGGEVVKIAKKGREGGLEASPIFVYTQTMLMIVWDEPKRQTNLAKHGLDFADLDEGFFLASIVVPAKGYRHMAIGRLADGTIAVVFATLGSEAVSVISMRPASRKERNLL